MISTDSTILNQMADSTVQTFVKTDTVVVKDTVVHTVNDTITKTVTSIDTIKQTVTQPAEESIQFVAHNTDQTIPFLLILGLFVLGGIIWLIFKVLGDYITPFIKSKYKIKRADLFVYRLQMTTWFAFALFCFYQLVSSHLIIGLALTVFVSLLGLNFWKDFFTGIYLKFSGNLNVNDKISINGLNGKVLKFNTRNIQIETDNDEVVFIPYRQFLEAEVSKKLNKGEMRSKKITLTLDENHPNNTLKQIEKTVALCPWVYSHKPVKVTKIKPNTYEVTVYASDDFTFNKIQSYLFDKVS